MASETSLCRERLKRYCAGYGLDIGYGGDPILPSAITIDVPKPYKTVGDAPLNLGGDARKLYWFRDETMDYVFSSHLLEDFPADETEHVLREWLRVLKVGGHLILYCPVEKVYRAHCKDNGQEYNLAHKIEEFGLDYVKGVLRAFDNIEAVHEAPLVDAYSFEIVVKKISKSCGHGLPLLMRYRMMKDRLKAGLRPYKRRLTGLINRGV